MQLTKEEFYRVKGESYELQDREAIVRYENALRWMSLEDKVVVREIGCKYAVLGDMLTRLHPQVDYGAVDIDEATLRRIPGYDSLRFVCHNVNAGIPYADASADYIVCLELLEHLENATAFLAEVRRVLKPRGRLILSVPNPYCWMEWLGNLRKEPDDQGHVATFTYQNIDALLRFGGLVLRSLTGTFTRVPFSRRLLGRYALVRTSNPLLTRSLMYLIEKP